jgi:hypothetical protein
MGPLSHQYADFGGQGSTAAAQTAVKDAGLTGKGCKVDIICGDHPNKPDIDTALARQWFDVDKCDVIVGAPHSAAAFAGRGSNFTAAFYFDINDQPARSSRAGRHCSGRLNFHAAVNKAARC